MITGTQFIEEMRALPDWPARSAAARRHILAGDHPSWLTRPWYPINATITELGTGKKHVLTYFVSPDPVSVGTDEDYVDVPLIPADAQIIADKLKAILPTRRMVTTFHAQAARRYHLSDVKEKPFHMPLSQIETVDAVMHARQMDRNLPGYDPNTGLQSGQRKAIVIAPNLDGSKVAIFGGCCGTSDGWGIQSLSTIHHAGYTDYSHGTWLVARQAFLDGVLVDLYTVFAHPVLKALVSDHPELFVPRFPNKGLPLGPAVNTNTGTTPPAAGPPKPGTPAAPPPHAPFVAGVTGTKAPPPTAPIAGSAGDAVSESGMGIGGAMLLVAVSVVGIGLASQALRAA